MGSSGRARRPAHDVRVPFLQPQRQGGRPVRDQVEAQQLDGGERGGQAGQDRQQDSQDLGQVAGQQVEDELADVGVDHPPLIDGRHDAGVVVIGQHHVGGPLGHVGAGDPHRHADVRSFQRRRVVHPVAGHGHHLLVFLEGAHDANLVLRRNPGKNVGVHHLVFELRVGHGLQRLAGKHLASGPQQPDFLRNGPGGIGVVAGDHHRAHAGPAGSLERLSHFRPGWVDHADQPHKGQAVLHGLRRGLCRRLGFHPEGQGQHPQRLAGHVGVGLQDGLADLVIQRAGLVPNGLILRAQLQDDVRRPLGGHHLPLVGAVIVEGAGILCPGIHHPVHGGHPLAGRIEGDLIDARVGPLQFVLMNTPFSGRHGQGRLGGIADHPRPSILPRLKLGIVVQGADPQGGGGGRDSPASPLCGNRPGTRLPGRPPRRRSRS